MLYFRRVWYLLLRCEFLYLFLFFSYPFSSCLFFVFHYFPLDGEISRVQWSYLYAGRHCHRSRRSYKIMKLEQKTRKLNREMLDALMEKNVNRVITTKLKQLRRPNKSCSLLRHFFFLFPTRAPLTLR